MKNQHVRWAATAFALIMTQVVATGTALADLTYITDFAKNGNLQNVLGSGYPASGVFTPTNGFGTSFNIVSDANGNNFEQFTDNNNQLFSPGSFTVNVGVAGVTDVYTLMNAYAPANGQTIAQVEFIGSAGADQTFNLVNGVDVRDYFQGAFANTINGTTTRQAFSYTGLGNAGGAHGIPGTFVLDEQHFALNSAFATQTLDKIVYTYAGNVGDPFLAGVTVATASSAVPEPASMTLMGLGISAIAIGRALRKRLLRS